MSSVASISPNDAADRDNSVSPVTLLGMRVDRVTMDDALACVTRWIDEKTTPRHIVTADASMVVTATQDAEFRDIVNGSDLVTPDGAGILWATKRLGFPVRSKVSGVDLAARCVALSGERKWSIYFLGAGPGVAEEARARMLAKYPDANIVGFRDGYFQENDEAELIAQIRDARPDVLLVALGIPKQEKFIHRHKAALGVPVLIGVGGTLDVFSGTVRRAPLWMQRAGLEWLYRLASNPKKISKVALLPTFARMVLAQPRTAPK